MRLNGQRNVHHLEQLQDLSPLQHWESYPTARTATSVCLFPHLLHWPLPRHPQDSCRDTEECTSGERHTRPTRRAQSAILSTSNDPRWRHCARRHRYDREPLWIECWVAVGMKGPSINNERRSAEAPNKINWYLELKDEQGQTGQRGQREQRGVGRGRPSTATGRGSYALSAMLLWRRRPLLAPARYNPRGRAEEAPISEYAD
jgi:hypothetical protein